MHEERKKYIPEQTKHCGDFFLLYVYMYEKSTSVLYLSSYLGKFPVKEVLDQEVSKELLHVSLSRKPCFYYTKEYTLK